MTRTPLLPRSAESTSASVSWLRAGYDWRSSAYAVAAPFVGLASLPAVLAGRPRTAYRWQRGLAVRLLDAPITEPARGRLPRALAHAVLPLPLQLLSCVLTAVLWGDTIVRGLCYPLAEWGNDVSSAWGGPTMAGAWLAHFGVALLTLALVLPILRAPVVAQRRLAVRLLGAPGEA
ncbi:hypothetical protein [Kitasatospora sp. NPDC059571]|uniref:hypothetical protein n=1 Tax=Kitasatospora sp. NPDC059571 TaxID=3346871 RepID=UPI003699A41D